jgi:O-antigen/teichoic acid export membrane protein
VFKERNKRSEKSLVKNSTLNVIKQISTLAFSLVTFPYVSRVIGSANYGKYSFAASIVEYLLLIAGAGSGTYAIREGARYRDNKSREEKFCSEIFSLNIITTIIAYAILAILFIFWGKLKSYADVLTVLSIRIVATTIGVEWIFSIYEDYLNITIRQIITQLVGLVLTLVLVRNETDYVLYAVATVVAMSGANVVNLFISRRYVNLHFTLQISKKHFKPVVYILFYSAMMTIYASSDITMMGILSTDRNVGIYSVASKIYGMAKNVFIAAMVPLIPRISYEFGQNDTKKNT